MKQTRARSEEAKTEQIERIIETSRDIFLKEGFKGFSMRSLANRLRMSQSNLYNYRSSKRELWFDIVKYDFKKFEEELVTIAEKHQGNVVELLENIAKYYFASILVNVQNLSTAAAPRLTCLRKFRHNLTFFGLLLSGL